MERTVVPKLNAQLDTRIDRATENLERFAGIDKTKRKKRKAPHSPAVSVRRKKTKRRNKGLTLEEIINETE